MVQNMIRNDPRMANNPMMQRAIEEVRENAGDFLFLILAARVSSSSSSTSLTPPIQHLFQLFFLFCSSNTSSQRIQMPRTG